MKYKGARWFKCDLHLHTPASICFQDKSITAEQWVDAAISKGLNCVAVTDHNTGSMIDDIKKVAEGKDLTVFPGVEITCDPSKIHLLIIFDHDKTSDDVNDFLIKCEIPRLMFGEQDAFTSLSIFQIAEIANKEGALIIPAHIDEYNGLESLSVANLKKLFSLSYINAVQVVHKEFLEEISTPYSQELKDKLNLYYSNPNPTIDDTQIKRWYTPVKCASDAKIAFLSFSDNPHEPNNPKHGIWGIGKCFTWIKMDERPSLEGLRQAFLLHRNRIKQDYSCLENPYQVPDLWIKSLEITNTTITNSSGALKVDFSPQLTTIIGGRGSGKSSLLRFIRGTFNKSADIRDLKDIFTDQNDFYKRFDSRSKKGVLTENSEVIIEFVRYNIQYRIKASNITTQNSQEVIIQKYDKESVNWVDINDEGFIDFFDYEQYSQKQIYEIAQEPNCLRERIDGLIENIEELKNNKEVIKRSFFEKSTSIRTIQQQVAIKGKIQTEIKDLDERIKLFHESGIAELLKAKEEFTNQEQLLNTLSTNVKNIESHFDSLIDELKFENLDLSTFDQNDAIELLTINTKAEDDFKLIKERAIKLKDQALETHSQLINAIKGSEWRKKYEVNLSEFSNKKAELESKGIDDLVNFEILSHQKANKEKELAKLIELEESLIIELNDRLDLQKQYLRQSKDITRSRQIAVSSIIPDSKVKISVKPFRNKNDFEYKLRSILQKENSFERDIDALIDICFNGNVERTILTVRNIFTKIRNGENTPEVSGYFYNLVQKLNDAQLDEIELLLPEDEIEIEYKPSGSSVFKPLSTASAGQKTTAILTFILSHGRIPLLLDQPEDDLDNRLVYELIVDRLKYAKEQRQIIVVTHNANIPVNGDAEYIISMNSESKKLEVLHSGTVDIPNIKKEICDVMEGSKQAFTMRAIRYQEISLN